MAKKQKSRSLSGERVFRVWVGTSPTGSLFSMYDTVADNVEDAAAKARRMARRDGCSEPCVSKVELLSVLD